MDSKKKKRQESLFSGRYNREFVEVACPVCKQSKIICLPEETIPKCDFCHQEMILKEVLTEGKY